MHRQSYATWPSPDFANDLDSAKIEKLRRQAEVLEFIINHPEQIGEIFNQQEEQEKEK